MFFFLLLSQCLHDNYCMDSTFKSLVFRTQITLSPLIPAPCCPLGPLSPGSPRSPWKTKSGQQLHHSLWNCELSWSQICIVLCHRTMEKEHVGSCQLFVIDVGIIPSPRYYFFDSFHSICCVHAHGFRLFFVTFTVNALFKTLLFLKTKKLNQITNQSFSHCGKKQTNN